MAQYKINNKDDLLLCPFDNTHMIRTSRMQYHIMQCKKNHPGKKWGVCPFNARHYFLSHEEKHHTRNCPDKAIIEKDLLYADRQNEGTYFHGDCSVPEYNNNVVKSIDGEDWDSECDHHAKPFKWGETPINDHFYNRSQELLEADQHLRLPRGTPQVLGTPHGAKIPVTPTVSQSGTGTGSQRLPRTLPATAAMAMAGRGRGVASLQSEHNVTWGQPREPATTNGGMVGNRGQQQVGGPSAPRGRGRGNNTKMNADSTVGINSNAAFNSGKNTSNRNSTTRENQASRGGRRVNAAPIGFGPVSTNNSGAARSGHGSLSSCSRSESSSPSTGIHHQMNGMRSSSGSSSSTPERRSSPVLSYAQQAVAPSPTMPRHNTAANHGAPAQNTWTNHNAQTTNPASYTATQAYQSSSTASVTPQNTMVTPQPTMVTPEPLGIVPHFGLMGIGRGRGMMLKAQAQQAQFIVPNVNQNGSTDTASTDQNKKLYRKYSKKIRDIESLEQKQSHGEKLNEEELAKVASKKDLLNRIRELNLGN